MKSVYVVILACLALISLTACGQKGSLYLPGAVKTAPDQHTELLTNSK